MKKIIAKELINENRNANIVKEIQPETSSPSNDRINPDPRNDLMDEANKAYYFLQEKLEESKYIELKQFHEQLAHIWEQEPWNDIVSLEAKKRVLSYFSSVFKIAKMAIHDPSDENLKNFHACIQEIQENNVAPVSEKIAITPYKDMFEKLEQCVIKHSQLIRFDNAANELETLTKDRNSALKILGADVLAAAHQAKASSSSRILLPDLTKSLIIAKETVNHPEQNYDQCLEQANKINMLSWGQVGRAVAGALTVLSAVATAVATALTPLGFVGLPLAIKIMGTGIGSMIATGLATAGSFLFLHNTKKDMRKINPVAESMQELGEEARRTPRH